MGNTKKQASVFAVIGFSLVLLLAPPAFALNNTYSETFDNRQSDATINGVDSWSVSKGLDSSVVVQSSTVFGGGGKALKLVGTEDAVDVSRNQQLGNVSPAWIEYVVRPGIGSQVTPVPTDGIGAVSFNYDGNIMAADGTAWVSTGQTFNTAQWYRILMKLDFATHTYALYISTASTTKIPFVPDKQNLKFINNQISAINAIGFKGVFNPADEDNTFIDEMVVHFIQRLEVTSPVQTVVKDMPTNAITVQLQNANSEPQTAWKDLTLTLSSSAVTGQFSLNKDNWVAITQIIIPEGGQEATFYYKDSTTAKPMITIKESPDRGWQEALHQITVVDEIRLFDVSATTPQVAGIPFNVQITAREEDGDINNTYQGTVRIYANYMNPASGTLQITPDAFSGFQQGVANVLVSYPDAGVIEIAVEDSQDSEKHGVSGQITFAPDRFSIAADPVQIVAKSFPVTVSAYNALSQLTPNYKGPASLQAIGVVPPDTSGGAVSPAVVTGESFQGGSAQINLQYNRWGTVTLEVSDQAFADKKASSNSIVFKPNNLALTASAPPAGRDYFYTGEAINVTLSVMDFAQLPIANFAGTVILTEAPDLNDIPDQFEFLGPEGGRKIFAVTPTASGNYILNGESMEYALTVQSPPIQVKQASVEVISSVAPVGTTEVEIQLLDETGKRITTESNVSFIITVTEDDPNNSVFSTELGKPILFKNGLAKVIIGNTQAETVTIGAQTQYGFQIKSGTITFGKVGKSGIGTLMWWESKDDDVVGDEELEAEKEEERKREEDRFKDVTLRSKDSVLPGGRKG